MVHYIIHCIGDSLTAGHRKWDGTYTQETYQYWMERLIRERMMDLTGRSSDDSFSFEIHSHGVPGATISGIARQLNAIRLEPDIGDDVKFILVVMGGTNDFWMFSSMDDDLQNKECIEDVYDTMDSIVSRANSMKFDRIFICTVPPVMVVEDFMEATLRNIRALNDRLKEYYMAPQIAAEGRNGGARPDNVSLIDVYSVMEDNDGQMKKNLCVGDGVHFTVEGNRICGETIAERFLNVIKG